MISSPASSLPQVPSAAERKTLAKDHPQCDQPPSALARINARRLLRTRFPKVAFRLRSRASTNGDVQRLEVSWPALSGSPSLEDVERIVFPFWSMGRGTRPSDDGMDPDAFRDMYGHANIMDVRPRTPTPAELEKHMGQRFPAASPVGQKNRL